MHQTDQIAAHPSPEHIFDTLNAYQKSGALKAAIELGVFSAIGQGKTTPSELAEVCGAAERGVRILCDYLVVNRFLTKQDNTYGLTPESAMFLDQHSPAYMGGCTEFLLAPQLVEGFKDITAIVRNGGTIMPESGTMAPEHPIWVKFARAMAPMMVMPARMLANVINNNATAALKVLDIAAGHGMYGITIAQQNPNAHIVALDWQSVLQVAKENAQRAGVTDRFSTIKGSAFDVDWSHDYDVVLLPNFLHHFDVATNTDLLRKAYAALKAGGRVAIVEFVPNPDRVSPPIPAAFALMMLGGTASGDVYTYAQLESMCRAAGFTRAEAYPLQPSPQTAVIAYK